MGIHKEVRKVFGSSVLNYMISARTAQGYEDFRASTPQERADIIMCWKQHKADFQSQKQNLMETGGPDGQESGHLSPKGFLQTRHLSFDERKRLHEERKARRIADREKIQSKDGHRNCPFCRRSYPHSHKPRDVQESAVVHDGHHDDANIEFENAIHASVQATSRGDPDEDMVIERAIRASVRELQKSSDSTITDQEALNRAIQASIAESNRSRASKPANPITMTDDEQEHQILLEKAIQESLANYQLHSSQATEDNEFKLALQMSKEAHPPPEVNSDEDEDVKSAIQKSKDELHKTKTEEEIVLEYVKKQSLIEAEHKKAMTGKQKEAEVSSEADEEALRMAIEESMKGAHGGGGGEASRS
jgi:hypothetical protein